MALYPIFLDLTRGSALVAGAGSVGRRKIDRLLEAGVSEILVLDTGASLSALPSDARIRFERRAVTAADVAGRTLVFAATSDSAENVRIAALCEKERVLCNVADDQAASAFHVPGQAVCGDIQVAVATGGHSPALAKRIRREAGEILAVRYAPLATLMGRLRPLVLAEGRQTAENTALFRALVESELADTLAVRDAHAAYALLRAKLPASLHARIDDLLQGLC